VVDAQYLAPLRGSKYHDDQMRREVVYVG
jgi:hypothetical protein